MFKRIGLFLITNLAILLVISFILRIFNIEPYLTKHGLNYESLLIFSAIVGFTGSFISLFISNNTMKISTHSSFAEIFSSHPAIKKRIAALSKINRALYSSHWLGDHFYVPFWVVISCHFVIALGTLFGGWRIVHTMGNKITQLNTLKGCCAETSAAIVIFAATDFGVPVSTTHTVTGSIAGVRLSHSFWGTQWSMMNTIFITWLITIPASAGIAAIVMLIR